MREAIAQPLAHRGILTAAGAGLFGTALAGCDLLSTAPEDESATGRQGDPDAKEAPALAELVKAGKLPALRDRLPRSPAVVQPVEQTGSYGGQWRNAMLGAGDAFRLGYTLGYENLVRWNLSWDEVVPGVAEEFEIDADGRRYTFRLRAGMNWSDGEPFTADDLVFAYNDVLLHKDVNPVLSTVFSTDGKPATVEKLDEQTVAFVFEAPNGLFLERIASDPSQVLTRLPAHHLKAFHPDHRPDADAAAKEAGYTNWIEAMQTYAASTDGLWQDVALPRLHAWLPTAALGDDTSRMVFERNPYYWKTDSEGRQLPYLDGIVFDLADDAEVLVLKVAQGEIDMLDRHVNTTENKPILARDRETGDFDFFDLVSEKVNTMTIMLNLTNPDEVKREIVRNKDFRIGLLHAINREEIITAVHARQGEPWQIAPQQDTEFFDEEMAKQYTEFDVDLANEHLDRAFADRDGDGYRLGQTGERISLAIDASTGAGKPHLIDGLELVRGYWKDVGVDVRINAIDATLFSERREGNQADGIVWDGDGGLDVILAADYYIPLGGYTTGYAQAWADWYHSAGAEGEEPPAATRQQMELYDELITLVDPAARVEVMREILAIAKEEFYTIGISTTLPGYGVVRNSFKNMVEETFFAANFPYLGATHPEQYFLETSE